MADGEIKNGRVSNRNIYDAVTDLRLELGEKIDKNRERIGTVDKSLGVLENKVDTVCKSTADAAEKAAAVDKEITALKVADAKSNKIAAAISTGISSGLAIIINGAVALWQTNK